MNILFVTIAWPAPDNRNLYSDLMDEFVRNGNRVYVAGTYYNLTDKKDPELTKENGISILRISSGKIRKAGYLCKAISLFTLGQKFYKAINQFYGDENIDLIIAPTPPITLSGLFKKLKKKYQASFYLLLKDIWPQDPVDLGVFSKSGFAWLYFRFHELRIYKVSDYIGCMSPLGADYILSKNRCLKENKVEVCPNSIYPCEMEESNDLPEIRKKYTIPEDACVFIFSGNLGIGHGLHFLVDAIHKLADYRKAFFVIGGSGTHFEYLENSFKDYEQNNVLLYSWLPKSDFDQIRATSDVGIVLVYKSTSPQFPSRLLSYLEYSKPVLCAVNNYTDIGEIVEEANCGISVNHGDIDKFIQAIKYFAENVENSKKMGRNGRKLLLNEYTVSKSYDIIMKHFTE